MKPTEIINACLPVLALIGAFVLFVRGDSASGGALLAFAVGHLVPSPIGGAR